jgi:hypothetical protein
MQFVIRALGVYRDVSVSASDLRFLKRHFGGQIVVLATGPVLDPAGFIGLRGNGLTPSKIDDFLSVPSL